MTRAAAGLIAATVLGSMLLAACSSDPSPGRGATAPASSAAGTTSTPPVPAATARTASSERQRVRPDEVVLPGGTVVPLTRARTVDGVLQVPEDVSTAGWWDGSAYAGDPFGTTVLAGHVDSAAQGVGAFASLLRVRPGAEVTVRGQGGSATYRVTTVRSLDKSTLATGTGALDQRGAHALVLITCTGTFDPVRRHYDQNLVVTATPIDS